MKTIVSIFCILSLSAFADSTNHLRDAKSVSCQSQSNQESFKISFPDIQYSDYEVNYGEVLFQFQSQSGERFEQKIAEERQARFIFGPVFALQLMDSSWEPLAFFEFDASNDDSSNPTGSMRVWYQPGEQNPEDFICQFSTNP